MPELDDFGGQSFAYSQKTFSLSEALKAEIDHKNRSVEKSADNPLGRLGGSLAFHCTVDEEKGKVIEAAAMATAFRGYEALLPGRDLNKVGLVSATASGICGGVHATASALCLEMALGLKPPPLGIVIRNLLLSCQYLNDTVMHLYILSGPDYSQDTIEKSNPEVWEKARRAPTKNASLHGYQYVSEIMTDLNKPDGMLYRQALEMVRKARKAYACLGGKYPHSDSIVPGGVTITPEVSSFEDYKSTLKPFGSYSEQTIALWNDIFDFMLEANPRFEDVGRSAASMVDFGQWDHEDVYDSSYQNCDEWGEQRWSTPGALINGELVTTRLSEINAGLEEFCHHSYNGSWVDETGKNYRFREDPAGNPLSPYHPWNKKVIVSSEAARKERAYSWGNSLTWRRNTFEVGAYARMYISAKAEKIPASRYLASTGKSLEICLPGIPTEIISWDVPKVWNAIERNRARAYAVAQNYAATLENYERALSLLQQGEVEVRASMDTPDPGVRLGTGLWGAGRGFLAHWAVLENGRIDNYQLAIPSRINVSPRTPWGALGPTEQAVVNTPILETGEFTGIDIQRALQSFDPCMTCTTHILQKGSGKILNGVVDTSFPI
ncbi:MAG: nickel-dependent hydrogenase large subunit [Endozoicomonas sp.]